MNFAIRKLLPEALRVPLWGNRRRWGLVVDEDDPSWKEWQKTNIDFYVQNQREGIGTKVNDAGYRVMADIDLSGKRVLEIGAGDIRHLRWLKGLPSEYLLADISTDMMEFAQQKLEERGIPLCKLLLRRDQRLPLADNSIDVIVSFYSLEHLYPLRPYLEDMYRVLSPGGILIGAIPAEGGLAWAGGRMLTSRRWFKRNTTIDPDKIICWEHPNFADHVVSELDQLFQRKSLVYWPLAWAPILDLNHIVRFQYRKPS